MGPSPHAIRTRQIPPSAGSFFIPRLRADARLRPSRSRAQRPRVGPQHVGKCPRRIFAPLRTDNPCTPGGCPCVRSEGGGDGHRPAPGDIRTQGHPPGATGKTNTRTGSLNPSDPMPARVPHPDVPHLPARHGAVIRTPLRADNPSTPGGCPCVRSKGGGDGHRPAPGDIRTQGHPPGATRKTHAPAHRQPQPERSHASADTTPGGVPPAHPTRCRRPHTAACRQPLHAGRMPLRAK